MVGNTMEDHIRIMKATQHCILGHRRKCLAENKEVK